ncbi:uncharacterized protein LOC131427739 isoform X2 [Malaya genurostris]|uniref:uncharacterized protein LOC131427739 isoform X2 n=1 Tax=Malaya genurostris TaxID=325434 RepID=UPI0026F3D4BC|nr:uncharacterized protein LOC131427739 isoform X2 [Malaya genurostris]
MTITYETQSEHNPEDEDSVVIEIPVTNAKSGPLLPGLSPDRLKELLEQTVFGKQLLESAGTHPLSNCGRKLVVDTVAKYHLNQNRKTSAEVVDDLSEVIFGLFRKERKDTYYIPKAKSRCNPAGKLYSRINYIKQSERKRDLEEQQHVSRKNGDIRNVEHPSEVTLALEWLDINKFPWTTVLTQWEISFSARKVDLRQYSKFIQIIKNYPHLGEEFGYQLLDIDYRKLELGNPTDPSKKWNSMFESVAIYVNKNAKDCTAKSLSQALQNSELSQALNTVLIPVKASKDFKPTVATSQAETFLLAGNKENAFIALSRTLKIYEEYNFPIPPKILIIGNSLDTAVNECMVVYEDIIYTLPTIVRGIDVLLKLHIVLGLLVAKISKLVWIFIEQFVYGVPSEHGGYLAINNLIQFLNSQT